MDDLVDVVDVERAGPVGIDRVGDVLEQGGELRLGVATSSSRNPTVGVCRHSRPGRRPVLPLLRHRWRMLRL
jgi:hypothetical protein